MNNIPIVLMSITLGMIIGAGATSVYFSQETSPSKEKEVENTHISHDMHSEMDSMMHNLEGKSGDEFDRVFLDDMIVHHEGAVQMSQAALERASHEEIKNLARNIIKAQEEEIAQMKEWRMNWFGI